MKPPTPRQVARDLNLPHAQPPGAWLCWDRLLAAAVHRYWQVRAESTGGAA